MMGWVIMLLLALAVGGLMWRFLPDTGARQFLGAALLIALAGYAWQGRPGLAGAPKPAPAGQEIPDSQFAQMRPDLMGRFNNAASWMTLAESYQRSGDTRAGVQVIQSALRQNPNSPDLWVGLANALIMHSDGLVTPAAELAFQRAAQIAPEHPGPPFFRGLALAQGGRYDEAEQIWRRILNNAPPGAEWRSAIEEQLSQLAQLRMSGRLGPMPVGPPPGAGPEMGPAVAPGNAQVPAPPIANAAAPAR